VLNGEPVCNTSNNVVMGSDVPSAFPSEDNNKQTGVGIRLTQQNKYDKE